MNLSGNHIAHHRQLLLEILDGEMLLMTQQHVAADLADHAAAIAPVTIKQHHAASVIGAFMQQKRRGHDIAEQHQSAQMMQRHLQPCCPIKLDLERLVFQMQIAPLGHDEQRIQQLLHDFFRVRRLRLSGSVR